MAKDTQKAVPLTEEQLIEKEAALKVAEQKLSDDQEKFVLEQNKFEEEKAAFETAKADLEKSIAIARQAGVPDHHIILDPGIGFAKNTAQNIAMMQHLSDLVAMGYPVLLATSRKSMIGNVLNLPVEERLEGTSATVVYGIEKGCHMIRVHDVKEMARATYMTDVLVGKRLFKEEA